MTFRIVCPSRKEGLSDVNSGGISGHYIVGVSLLFVLPSKSGESGTAEING